MAPSIILDYSEEKKYSGEMMGKTQKFSKGYSSGFVSDYRHAVVETVAESEGFGSSGRVDTEMTASEDSCALPKRKCISLNVDSSARFGRPTQCFSLSKMSRSEKIELKNRLQAELDQVQAFQRKISMQVSNVVAVSSSSDIRSCSDGQKRPPFDTFNRYSEYSSGPTKRSVPLGRNGPSIKRAQSGRAEVKLVAPVNMPFAHLLKQCEALLKRMKAHQFAWAFLEPVDVVKLNIPDYLTVIKHPMDFSTIQKKLDSGQYSSPRAFLADVRLTFSNAMTYNPSGNKYHIMAANLSKFFEQRWKPIEKKLSVIEPPSVPMKLDISRESETLRQTLPSKKRKIFPADYEIKTQPVKTQPDKSRPVKRIMTDGEKIKLSKDIESLDLSVPEHIVNLLRGDCSGDADVDELEIDFETLSDDTLFEVRKLLDEFMLEKQANNAKDERCEMEILNESGLSNSSMQPFKGNDPAEEDVDIGGNDPPISSYPPVEIEKDAAHRTSKCSSSSSSSSDSGSSSSDSDTGSSSGSDSDGDKASSPARKPKENMAVVAPQARNYGGPQDGNQSVSGLDQLEQSFQPKPANIEADSRQEGESAPPEKVMRAAFMKRKFLDTIQKAREKTLDKGEKGNPEKLRREREELERKHREEKARLEAEVKAVEDAQRQLEEEAAAEAKRKRELEREAARLALQQMEKTVEINENCHFLEDLEMLRSTVAPCLQSVDETSPYHSPDGMGGFKLQGTNPLEQLGLFMKVDDEEEEEGEPTNVPEPAIDVEEGEID